MREIKNQKRKVERNDKTKYSIRSSSFLKGNIGADTEDISRQIQCSRGLWINVTL